MTWRYESFYFGNAGWPSDALWRIDMETNEYQLLISDGVGRASLEEVRERWLDVGAPDDRNSRIEPHYDTWDVDGVTYYGLRYWFSWTDQSAAQWHWEQDLQAAQGWGDHEATYGAYPALY